MDRWVALEILGSDVSWGSFVTRYTRTQSFSCLKLTDDCRKSLPPGGEMCERPETECSEELGPLFILLSNLHFSSVSFVSYEDTDSVG